MLVRMLTYLPWPGQPTEAGETIDLPEADALAYVRTGQAELVTPAVESATIGPAERNAMKHIHPQPKRRG